jgi:hypothetical protein
MKNMNAYKAPKVALTGVTALLSTMSLMACGFTNQVKTFDPLNFTPHPGKPVYPGNGRREVPIHSPSRDWFGTELVIEYCEGDTYLQYDPETTRLEQEGKTYPSINPMRITGHAAKVACADGRLTESDPVPPLDLSDLPE